MIYLIGGCPRVGKSTLAQKLVKDKCIPYVPLDTVVHMLKEGSTDVDIESNTDVPEKFYPFLERFIYHTKYGVSDYTIEGVAFTPRQAYKLLQEYEMRVCFLGTSSISLETVLKHGGVNNWLKLHSHEEQQRLVESYIPRSAKIKAECEEFNLQYFDMALLSYPENINKAFNYLIDF